jgi:hypothetical protein
MTVKERISLDYIIIYTGTTTLEEKERIATVKSVSFPFIRNDLMDRERMYRFEKID